MRRRSLDLKKTKWPAQAERRVRDPCRSEPDNSAWLTGIPLQMQLGKRRRGIGALREQRLFGIQWPKTERMDYEDSTSVKESEVGHSCPSMRKTTLTTGNHRTEGWAQ